MSTHRDFVPGPNSWAISARNASAAQDEHGGASVPGNSSSVSHDIAAELPSLIFDTFDPVIDNPLQAVTARRSTPRRAGRHGSTRDGSPIPLSASRRVPRAQETLARVASQVGILDTVDTSTSSIYAPSVSSNNSWAPTPSAPMVVPPTLSKILPSVDPVPPPPTSFAGYSQPTIHHALADMERRLHHHIDVVFEKLTKIIIEQTYKVIDDLSKVESIGEDQTRGTRSESVEKIVDLQACVRKTSGLVQSTLRVCNDTSRAVQSIETRLQQLEKSLDVNIHPTTNKPEQSQEQEAAAVTTAKPPVSPTRLQDPTLTEGFQRPSFLDSDGNVREPDPSLVEGFQRPSFLDSNNNVRQADTPLIEGYERPSFLDEHGDVDLTRREHDSIYMFELPDQDTEYLAPNGIWYELPSFLQE